VLGVFVCWVCLGVVGGHEHLSLHIKGIPHDY